MMDFSTHYITDKKKKKNWTKASLKTPFKTQIKVWEDADVKVGTNTKRLSRTTVK